jgi:hypothetical protein
MAAKRAAIARDEIAESKLSDVTAAQFLEALDADPYGSAMGSLKIWPEKKKVELWTEPEHYGGISVGTIRVVLKEKKKLELEKHWSTEIHKRVGVEDVLDPRLILRDPAFIRDVAREVAVQLRAMG